LNPETFLGFDFGTKHIGVAIGNSLTQTAEPLTTLSQPALSLWPAIDQLILKWKPSGLVVGLPLNMDQSEDAMTQAARKFGNHLKDRYNLPVHMIDERLSSRTAQQRLEGTGISSPQQRRKLHGFAAQAILESFLLDYLPKQP
jgi:putative holliday junction resolvase